MTCLSRCLHTPQFLSDHITFSVMLRRQRRRPAVLTAPQAARREGPAIGFAGLCERLFCMRSALVGSRGCDSAAQCTLRGGISGLVLSTVEVVRSAVGSRGVCTGFTVVRGQAVPYRGPAGPSG